MFIEFILRAMKDDFFNKRRVLEATKSDFEDIALELFQYQAKYNKVYAEYLKLLRIPVLAIRRLSQIPFLPISLFKSHIIKSGKWQAETIFTSSGTTGQIPSRHFVKNLTFYLENARKGFTTQFGSIQNYCVLALLPSYLERSGSSLVAMADDFIQRSKYKQSGFFLNETKKLIEILQDCQKKEIPTLLIGVSFALLDLAEKHSIDLSKILIMETGGMKGRRKEMVRSELHQILKNKFHVEQIYSEYGMTELLSQAYTNGGNLFYPASTLQVLIREVNDPFCILPNKRNGAVNLIDLANVDTCSFIATQDLGKRYENGSFEIFGRLDESDLRGCNLMVYDA